MSMKNTPYRFLYLHSGGTTAVLNRTFKGIADISASRHAECVLSPRGILGLLHQQLIYHREAVPSQIASSPGSFLASARFQPSEDQIITLLQTLLEHDIQGLVIQGGDDSQQTLYRLHQCIQSNGLPIQCIGLPKTIDNDLYGIHASPGYPSAAKYLATSFMEAAWDMLAMHHTSTKVFILETMGRNAGWLAASTSLASHRHDIPHLLCLPEHLHDRQHLADAIQEHIIHHGFCMITLAEGYPFEDLPVHYKDSFEHPQLGYQGPLFAAWVEKNLHVKVRYARPDCLQRAAGHLISQYDWDLSYLLGSLAVQALLDGKDGVMIGFSETSFGSPTYLPLEHIIAQKRHMPSHFITHSGYQTTTAFVDYLEPLITGEIYPTFVHGLPDYAFPARKKP